MLCLFLCLTFFALYAILEENIAILEIFYLEVHCAYLLLSSDKPIKICDSLIFREYIFSKVTP